MIGLKRAGYSEETILILKEAFRKNPDLELAKQLLPSGDPAVLAFLRSRFTKGSSAERTEAARVLGLTRGRLTQLMNLLLLGAEIQERVLRKQIATERP